MTSPASMRPPRSLPCRRSRMLFLSARSASERSGPDRRQQRWPRPLVASWIVRSRVARVNRLAMSERGGPQFIPRPQAWSHGDPPEFRGRGRQDVLAVDVLGRADRDDVDALVPQRRRKIVVQADVLEPGLPRAAAGALERAARDRHHPRAGVLRERCDVLRRHPAGCLWSSVS